MDSKKLVVFFSFLVFFVLLVLGLLVAALRTRTSYLGKAAEKSSISLQSSYLFGSPLVAQANGEEKVRISAFLLNEQGRGVAGKEIQVFSDPPLTIKPIQPQTDKFGQAIFEASSSTPGQFTISASVDGRFFPRTVTLTFR